MKAAHSIVLERCSLALGPTSHGLCARCGCRSIVARSSRPAILAVAQVRHFSNQKPPLTPGPGHRRLSGGNFSNGFYSVSPAAFEDGISFSASGAAVLRSPQRRSLSDNDLTEMSPRLESSSTIEDKISPAASYPTVLQQVRDNMDKYRECVVLTRVGSFYELYFEQADELGPLLGLKLSSKRAGGKRIAMSGFPFFQLDRYLKALVQDHGKHVAIAEEVANDPSKKVKSGGLLFDRQIKRVITPGTLIDEDFLPPTDNNYLLAVFMESSRAGLAWLDLSNGDFYTQSLDQNQLASAIFRITPREMILHKAMKDTQNPVISSISAENGLNITYFDGSEDPMQADDWKTVFEDKTNEVDQSFPTEEQSSMNMILQYLQSHLPGLDLHLKPPQRWREKEHMTIDKSTLRALEITKTLRDGSFKGSLLHAVRRTSTESGARMLARRLSEYL